MLKDFCVSGKLCWESVDELYGYHSEADTRIAFHGKQADINILEKLQCGTMIQIFFLANINLFNSGLWCEPGLDYNNIQEYL